MDGEFPTPGSVGDIVLYRMTTDDAADINRRRTSASSIGERAKNGLWPRGAQGHLGSLVRAGDSLPAVVVRVPEQSPHLRSLKVFLDGNDDFWCMATAGLEPGQWRSR